MNQIFLYERIQTPSSLRAEFGWQKKIMYAMRTVVDTFETDVTNYVISVFKPASLCKVLLAGHVDEIGLMMTDAGWLKVTDVGKIRVLN